MEVQWIAWAFMSMVLLGIYMSFFKLPSVWKGVDSSGMIVWSALTGVVMALALFYDRISVGNMSLAVLAVAFIQGVALNLRSLAQIKALKFSQTNALFPTTSITALLVVILVGVAFFSEKLSLLQISGVVLAFATLLLFAYKGGKWSFEFDAMKWWIAIVALSVVGNLSNKAAAELGDVRTFWVYSCILGLLFSLAFLVFQKRKQSFEVVSGRNTIIAGISAGIFGYSGGYCLLVAISKGPISIVQTVNSSYVFVTAIIAALFFGEQFTRKKIFLVMLGILALGLIRMGSM